jgi:CHAT domain-containing protein
LCPTGVFAFLPLHAAGDLENVSPRNVSQYCVTSYISTISSLLKASRSSKLITRSELKVLIGVATSSTTHPDLPAARDEVSALYDIMPTNSIMKLTESIELRDRYQPSMGTSAKEILESLPEAVIAHFACHGVQDHHEPLRSGFVMQDRTLPMSEIMSLRLRNARFAFLSACETAKGDSKQPDQALHLAAAMFFAGFTSVIGTMWSMGDIDGPIIARHVYKRLLDGDGDIEFSIIPYALDEAVCKLRDSGVNPSRWAPYVHIGF